MLHVRSDNMIKRCSIFLFFAVALFVAAFSASSKLYEKKMKNDEPIEKQAKEVVNQPTKQASATIAKKVGETKKTWFYMYLKSDEILIYRSGERDLYDRVKIDKNRLSVEQEKKLKKGMIVHSLKELYSILESYTS